MVIAPVEKYSVQQPQIFADFLLFATADIQMISCNLLRPRPKRNSFYCCVNFFILKLNEILYYKVVSFFMSEGHREGSRSPLNRYGSPLQGSFFQ